MTPMAVMVGTAAHQEAQWDKDTLAWWTLHESCLKPIWVAIMKTGCVGWRTRLLDVGCGTGGALMLGRGLGASLAGIDADEDRVKFAKNRIRQCDIRRGEVESLPFVDDCCTFVMSTDLVSHPRPGVKLVQEMCRVCSPSGKLAVAVWGDPERCDQKAVFEALGADDAFLYASEGALDRLIQEGCGKLVKHYECEAAAEYPSIEAAWIGQRQLGWAQGAIAARGAPHARTAFLGAMRRFCGPDGRVRMRNRFRFAILSKV